MLTEDGSRKRRTRTDSSHMALLYEEFVEGAVFGIWGQK